LEAFEDSGLKYIARLIGSGVWLSSSNSSTSCNSKWQRRQLTQMPQIREWGMDQQGRCLEWQAHWAWQDKWVLELLLLWGLDYQGACMVVDWQWVWED
jgi:hypothetical protein